MRDLRMAKLPDVQDIRRSLWPTLQNRVVRPIAQWKLSRRGVSRSPEKVRWGNKRASPLFVED